MISRIMAWIKQRVEAALVKLRAPQLSKLPAAFCAVQDTVYFECLNGPVQGAKVEAPIDATPGTACALPWTTTKGKQSYAVYILVDYNGTQGLMFTQSYSRPDYAQAKVTRLTAICAGDMA